MESRIRITPRLYARNCAGEVRRDRLRGLFDLEVTLARVGAQLERRYQCVVSTEMVWVIDERLVARLEYVPLEEGLAEVVWDEDCVSLHSHRLSRGEA